MTMDDLCELSTPSAHCAEAANALSAWIIAQITENLLNELFHLHSMGVLHRSVIQSFTFACDQRLTFLGYGISDIKPHNVGIILKELRAHLIDYQSSRITGASGDGSGVTLAFSPQISSAKETYEPKFDYGCLGRTLSQLLSVDIPPQLDSTSLDCLKSKCNLLPHIGDIIYDIFSSLLIIGSSSSSEQAHSPVAKDQAGLMTLIGALSNKKKEINTKFDGMSLFPIKTAEHLQPLHGIELRVKPEQYIAFFHNNIQDRKKRSRDSTGGEGQTSEEPPTKRRKVDTPPPPRGPARIYFLMFEKNIPAASPTADLIKNIAERGKFLTRRPSPDALEASVKALHEQNYSLSAVEEFWKSMRPTADTLRHLFYGVAPPAFPRRGRPKKTSSDNGSSKKVV